MTTPITRSDPSTDNWSGIGLRRWHSTLPVMAAALVVLAAPLLSTGPGTAGHSLSSAGSVLGVLVMGAAWVVLPAPFGFTVATVTALSLLERATLGDPTLATLVGGTLGLQVAITLFLLVALVLETANPGWVRRDVGLLIAILGLASLVVWEPVLVGAGYGAAAALLAVGTAVLLYALHRYALVRTGEVTNGD